ncbi:MAG: GNAT family N-acetyltransferase [Acidobacteria bacterium]|nr:GNAT family N-acetyltransferase [Acidobacteriota bacterium]
MSLHLRPAMRADLPVILKLIEDLADYEKLRHACVATREELDKHLFGEHPWAEVVLAEWEGEVAGFALFFHTFSTFLAKPGIYLEDLFVVPERRGRGIGKALLVHLARLAMIRGCGRVEWSVLDWNTPSIEFYESLRARQLKEWHVYRLTGAELEALAGGKPD